MNDQANGVVWRFGTFEVRGRMGELFHDGTPIRLQDQPRRLLLYLLEHAGDVVTRDEVRQHLWPAEKFLDFEHGLNTVVKKLRDALGDSATEPQYIETVPRQGYRFIIPVTSGERVELAAHNVTFKAVASWLVISTLILLATAQFIQGRRANERSITSIAVLPLENLSGDPKQEYLADGMTESLITDLGQLRGLSVISRTSVMRYKNVHKPLPQIARELHVDAIIEGSVMRSGNRMRVTTHLVGVSSDRPVWSEVHERELQDAMALEDDVARAIARHVHATLSPAPRAFRPLNPDAEEAYLHALHESDKYSEAGLRTAVDYFREAIRLEPGYAQAWAGLAEAYNLSVMFRFLPAKETLPVFEAAARRALQIDPNLSQAHVAMGELHWRRFQWRQAEEEFRRAIALNPNDATAHQMLGYHLLISPRFAESVLEMKRARALDPLSPSKANSFGAALFWAGRYGEAEQVHRELPDTDANAVRRHNRLWEIYERKGMEREAAREMITVARLWRQDDLSRSLEDTYRSAGYAECRKAFLESAVRDASLHARPLDPAGQNPVAVASLWAMLGNKDQAFFWLRKAFDEIDHGLIYLRVDHRFDNLRSDPRFERVLMRACLDDQSLSGPCSAVAAGFASTPPSPARLIRVPPAPPAR